MSSENVAKKFSWLNMVMRHVKFKDKYSDSGYNKHFNDGIRTVNINFLFT